MPLGAMEVGTQVFSGCSKPALGPSSPMRVPLP
jgi:hypothetical protein